MRRGPRGGPGEFARRLERAERLLDDSPGAGRGPLQVLVHVLQHQQSRGTAGVPGRTGLVQVDAGVVATELDTALDRLLGVVPLPLAEVGAYLRAERTELAELIESWLDDPQLVDPRVGFWIGVASGPPFELAARHMTVPSDWKGAACPVCGGQPQASVIAEESGEFMAGAPRSLVCGRCATWWPFPRATCVSCGEGDPRRLQAFVADSRKWVRVDTCQTCHTYIKTFDLRDTHAVAVVPLVDDVATLTLDVFARDQGYSRGCVSLAGV